MKAGLAQTSDAGLREPHISATSGACGEGDARHTPMVSPAKSPPASASAPRTQPQGAVRLRQLRFEDYSQVAPLEARYGFTLRSYERWSHVWLQNPAYAAAGETWPLGWVLENDRGQIVGSQSNVPRLYEIGGRRVIAATGRRMVVELGYRGYALWLMTALFEQKQADLCLGSVILHGIEAALGGAALVPVGAWEWYVFWITNYRATLAEWLHSRLPAGLRPLALPLRYPLAAALYLKDTRARFDLRAARRQAAVECLTAFDDRFDQFWRELKSEHPNLLLVVRTRAVLEWHFAYALLESRVWIWTVSEASRMVAYAIFLKDASGSRVSLVDFQALGGKDALLLPMLAAAAERGRREGVHVLENVGLGFEKSGINQLAPHRRQGSWLRFYYKTRDPNLAERLRDPAVWAPTPYERTDTIT